MNKKYELYYRNNNKEEILISNNITTFKECQEEIVNYLKQNIITFYNRTFHQEGNDFIFDFGSYSEFFILKNITEEELFSDEFNVV